VDTAHIRALIHRLAARVTRPIALQVAAANAGALDRLLLLNGQAIAFELRRRHNIKTLSEVEFRVFSQFGEDGILEWIIQRLVDSSFQVPETFVDFGVEDYSEANTVFLLRHRNWRGLVIDASDGNIARLRSSDIYWRHDITAISAFVTRENINALISPGFNGEIGVLSIDIDGNDYWVWQAIDCISPWIVVCEYNAVLGDVYALTVPYDPNFVRTAAHHSGLYAGCSIAALKKLASTKGYELIGSNGAGNNAFFVREAIAGPLTKCIVDLAAKPSHFRESRDRKGAFTHVGGALRRELIADSLFLDLATNKLVRLGDLDDLYSEMWR
jgi:hypothetical protein